MIIGNLNDTAAVEKMNGAFATAFEWLRRNMTSIHETGTSRVVIDEGNMWVNVETPLMKKRDEQLLELHSRFIDIHVPVDKDEVIGYCPAYHLRDVKTPYDAERDIAFYADSPLCYVTLHPGEFAVMFPHDAHAPIIGEGAVKKLCVKIRY